MLCLFAASGPAVRRRASAGHAREAHSTPRQQRSATARRAGVSAILGGRWASPDSQQRVGWGTPRPSSRVCASTPGDSSKGGTAENWSDTNWLQTSLNVAVQEEDFSTASKCAHELVDPVLDVLREHRACASLGSSSCRLTVHERAGSKPQDACRRQKAAALLKQTLPHSTRATEAVAAHPPHLRWPYRLKARLNELAGNYTGPTDWFNLGLPVWLVDRAERLGYRVPTEARPQGPASLRRPAAPFPGARSRAAQLGPAVC